MISTDDLAALVTGALADAGLPERTPTFERPRNPDHGDWATNVALTLAKEAGRPPRDIAAAIVERVASADGIAAVEVAGPGFINFRLEAAALGSLVRTVVAAGERYGTSDGLGGRRINVEFVSSNPTGPLHLGHARWAAVGDALARILEAAGADVTREFYFNDAGAQMARFGASVQAAMRGTDAPEDGYHGDYITELAGELMAAAVDPEDVEAVTEAGYAAMLERIKGTLARFNVRFDVYFGERALHQPDGIPALLDRLRDAGHVYDADGATWVRTTAFGDDKDRVVIRADGMPTYFAADIAYLEDKVAHRGFDTAMLILGADHHGYVRRLAAAEQALGHDGTHLEVLIGQMVNFMDGGVPARMSRRAGTLVFFDDLIDAVGTDATRYTLLRSSMDTTMDFDLAEVVRTERDNPVYYVQYSSARIAGILRTAAERGVDLGDVSDAATDRLDHPSEVELLRRMDTYPEVVAGAAADRAVHRVARYAEDLAEAFHRFYVDCQVVGDDAELTRARLWLCVAARRTLVNALDLLGVSAPERM